MSEPSRIPPEELLEHAGFLRGLALSLVFDEGRADDVVQEAMVVALQGKPRFRSRLRAWLAGITRNLALKSLRAETRLVRRERAAARDEAEGNTADAAARLEIHRRVVAAVQTLPEPYRTTIVHRYFDGSSVADIARAMDVRPRTVETRLRRAREHLRKELDRAHGGDRRAWCLGLAALVPFRIESASAKAAAVAVTGAVMGMTKTLVAALLVGGIAFFAAWNIKPDRTEREERAPDADVARGVAADDYETLKAENEAHKAQVASLRAELRRLHEEAVTAASEREAVAKAKAEKEKVIGGPRFAFADVEGLDKVDWDKIGKAMADMPPVLAEFAKGLAEGKPIDEMGDLIGKIQQMNGPLLGEALKLSKAGIGGTGVNGAFTHPSVMVNMVHAALSKAGKPLSEEQEQRLHEIGLRYTQLEKAREAGYGDDALGLDKLVDEATLKDKFFAEVFGVLGDDQSQRLRPDAIKGLTRVDIFDSSLLYSQVAAPMRFANREGLTSTAMQRIHRKLGLTAEHRASVEAAVRRWVQGLPDGFLDADVALNDTVPIMHRERVAIAARHQAALFKDLAKSVSLTPAQIKILQGEMGVLVPYKSR